MVFKRKKKPKIWARLKNFFWPSMGWKRSFSYIKHRAIRLNASSYAVSAGLAFGASISFAPTVGFHILQCFFLCLIFRANFIASVLGTLIGNPWTFPFLSLISYKIGWLILNMAGLHAPFAQDIDFSFSSMTQAPWAILTPMLIGGYIMAILTFPLFYFAFYSMIKPAREARRRLIKKAKRKNKERVIK